MDVNDAKAAHEDEVLAAPGVTGVAVGREDAEDVIVVFVEALTADNDAPQKLGLPARLDGFPVIVREIGTAMAQT